MIIQAVTGLDGNSYTRQQLAACIDNGLRIQGYLFPGGIDTKLQMFSGFRLEALWLDVELPISVSAVNAALALCDNWFGSPVGIYSGKWFFDQQGWSKKTQWANRPLWDSNYDHDPVLLTNFRPYGGWTKPTIKQFWGTSDIGHVHTIDQNVMGQ